MFRIWMNILTLKYDQDMDEQLNYEIWSGYEFTTQL